LFEIQKDDRRGFSSLTNIFRAGNNSVSKPDVSFVALEGLKCHSPVGTEENVS